MILAPARGRRLAFTLVELLVAIMIVGILATMVLFAMAGVTEQARVDRTASQILKINELLMEKWESYLTRRVPENVRDRDNRLTNPNSVAPRRVARNRLHALREMMRMELPDRITDVTDDPRVLQDPVTKRAMRPAASRAYLRRASKTNWTVEYQQSECLYLIVSQMREGDFSALEFFSENELGDLDGDGMPEILDAWGEPIRWMRWAPGFLSPLQDPVNRKGLDHFDPAQADSRYGDTDPTNDPFELRPLIISAGPDREFDIVFSSRDGMQWSKTRPPNDPYYRGDGEQFHLLGTVDDLNDDGIDNSLDNITNHLIETR